MSEYTSGGIKGLNKNPTFLYEYPKNDDISDDQKEYIQNYIQGFENALASENFLSEEDGYRQFINIESFIDFFLLNEISRNITIASPNAAVAVNDFVFWMGSKEFYVYGGTVQRLPCTVLDYVFGDFNRDQIGKVTAGHNSSYGEVWWFYPSKSSATNDRYVIYNYQEKVCYFGNLTRTAWVDRGINQYPIAAHTDNKLYYHEF